VFAHVRESLLRDAEERDLHGVFQAYIAEIIFVVYTVTLLPEMLDLEGNGG
jgi:hypothetical protein